MRFFELETGRVGNQVSGVSPFYAEYPWPKEITLRYTLILSSVWSIWFVWFIWFIWLVSFNQTNKTNQRNQLNQTD